MKYKILFLLVFVLLSFQFCGDNPAKPEEGFNLKFKFLYDGKPVTDLHNINEKHSSLGKVLSAQEYDKVKIVFFNLDLEYDKLYQNYENKSTELYNYTYGFEGDPLDFNDYWVKKDKGELDILTNGNYSIEKRSTLTISNGIAHGEFELAGGMKACRVGIFDDGILSWVGKSSGFAGGYFELHSHHGEDMGDYYIYINLEQVVPIFRP